MIHIRDFSFGYSSKSLLYENFSASLDNGNIYGLLGKNGAGKSTLLKNLIGLRFPTQGKISVNGYDPSGRLPSFLETIFFIPEEVNVPSLTIERYCQLYAVFYPLFNHEELHLYLTQLNIQTKARLDTLSFGQQKKFIIAFALSCNTPVLLLDEPTNGLDIPSKIQFRKLLASVMSADRTILISTHQIRDLENLIDHVLIVDGGKLMLSASVNDIAKKLSFGIMNDIQDDSTVIYSEQSLKGFSVIQQNIYEDETQVNLEQLFNAVIENPAAINKIMSSTQH